MQYRNSPDGYGAIPKALHWTTVVLILAAWMLGQIGDDLPSRAAEAASLFIHMSAGLLVLAILALRFVWRLGDPPPPAEPTALGSWLDRLAHVAHYALYAMLIAVPVSGIVLQFARGRGVPLFGISEIASPWTANRAFSRNVKEVHEVLANALVILAAVHAAAALFHHWVLRDRTLVRMLPQFRRN